MRPEPRRSRAWPCRPMQDAAEGGGQRPAPAPEAPKFDPDGGKHPPEATLLLTADTEDPVVILFTSDQSDPSPDSLGGSTMLYDGPLRLGELGAEGTLIVDQGTRGVIITAATMRKGDRRLSRSVQRCFVVDGGSTPRRTAAAGPLSPQPAPGSPQSANSGTQPRRASASPPPPLTLSAKFDRSWSLRCGKHYGPVVPPSARRAAPSRDAPPQPSAFLPPAAEPDIPVEGSPPQDRAAGWREPSREVSAAPSDATSALSVCWNPVPIGSPVPEGPPVPDAASPTGGEGRARGSPPRVRFPASRRSRSAVMERPTRPMCPDDIPLRRPSEPVTVLDSIQEEAAAERRRRDPEDGKFKTKLEWSGTAESWEEAEVENGERFSCDRCGRGWAREERMLRHRSNCSGATWGTSPRRHVTFAAVSSRGGTLGGCRSSGARRSRSAGVPSHDSSCTGHSGADLLGSSLNSLSSALCFPHDSFQVRPRSSLPAESADGAPRSVCAAPSETMSASASSMARARSRGAEPNIHNPRRGPLETAGKRIAVCRWCAKHLDVKSIDKHEKTCTEEPQRKQLEQRRQEDLRRMRTRSPTAASHGGDCRPRSVSPKGRQSYAVAPRPSIPTDCPGRQQLTRTQSLPLRRAPQRPAKDALRKCALEPTLSELEQQKQELEETRQKLKQSQERSASDLVQVEKQQKQVLAEIDRRRAIDGGRQRVPPPGVKAPPDLSSAASSSIMQKTVVNSQKYTEMRKRHKQTQKEKEKKEDEQKRKQAGEEGRPMLSSRSCPNDPARP
eukprot:TRINITY_DN46990_c0_g1_i1.p1 TRINITY_DN46990_c0_g1~~TRINITY_DN46990_c0_g1_i1.p1  ORF type:complete len:806 (+),score=182.41 TRINITY_DN46990_c0_g1_i1:65-2419(+)